MFSECNCLNDLSDPFIAVFFFLYLFHALIFFSFIVMEIGLQSLYFQKTNMQISGQTALED